MRLKQLNTALLSWVLILGLGAVIFGCANPASRNTVEVVTSDGGTPTPVEASTKPIASDPMSLGDARATVTLIEFSDYQCAYCRRFHDEVLPAIRKAYIDTGKIRFVFRDYPLSQHREALPAALAGRCAAAQGKFWQMNQLLFANQDKLTTELYPTLAATLTLDVRTFKECLEDVTLRSAIENDQRQAHRLGINATPGFLFGRMQGGRMSVQRVGNGFVDYSTLSKELDSMLSSSFPLSR